MKRGLGIYAAAIYAFLHVPLVTLLVWAFLRKQTGDVV